MPPFLHPDSPTRRFWRPLLRAACWCAIVVGVALGLYLTLRASSSFRDLWWMPEPVRHWAEYNGRLRNLPAFALLAVPCLILANGRRARRTALAGLAAFVAATEIAQYYIPTRWCEWQDVACGWCGLLLTWGVFELSFYLAWQLREVLRGSTPPRRETAPDHPSLRPALAAPPAKPGSPS